MGFRPIDELEQRWYQWLLTRTHHPLLRQPRYLQVPCYHRSISHQYHSIPRCSREATSVWRRSGNAQLFLLCLRLRSKHRQRPSWDRSRCIVRRRWKYQDRLSWFDRNWISKAVKLSRTKTKYESQFSEEKMFYHRRERKEASECLEMYTENQSMTHAVHCRQIYDRISIEISTRKFPWYRKYILSICFVQVRCCRLDGGREASGCDRIGWQGDETNFMCPE